MTNRTLSTAAQAVSNAAKSSLDWESGYLPNAVAAAALQAAANQVVPEFWHEDDDVYGETMQDVRRDFLAIATELKGNIK